MRSMHIHSDDTNQVHTISGNQCSAWIKQLALSQTYSSSPCLHSVSVRSNDASQTHLVQHYPLIALYYRLSQRLNGIHSTSLLAIDLDRFCLFHNTIDLYNLIAWVVLLIRRSRSSEQASMAFNLFSYIVQNIVMFQQILNQFPIMVKLICLCI